MEISEHQNIKSKLNSYKAVAVSVALTNFFVRAQAKLTFLFVEDQLGKLTPVGGVRQPLWLYRLLPIIWLPHKKKKRGCSNNPLGYTNMICYYEHGGMNPY